MFSHRMTLAFVVLIAVLSGSAVADEAKLAESIRKLDPNVVTVKLIGSKKRVGIRRMLSTDIRARRRKANAADVKAWRAIKTVKDWETFRDKRIAALKRSLGRFPEPPKDLKVRVTKTIRGDGFVIRNVVFQSRPGLWVTANLYAPAKPKDSMPGILICHSHHSPKTQGELQDMGMIWARAGCYVLVMDKLGHGERRQHPFRSAKDYAKPFRVSRQDYYFRYNVGIQLNLLGDGLIGWMAWDLMRGVDLLLQQPGIDSKRIILLGAVAGGGDPCAVTAAIDTRIAAAVPFNFGGPQPESVFPLPKDAELSFNYMGGGSWESTRNLRLSGRDGFLPWTIVGSIAPRQLVYAHEFSWDQQRDPVWKRFQSLYKLYGKPENLASAKGYGKVSLSSKQASHCNNIGSHHRKAGIYAAFEKWFGIPAPKAEYRERVKRSDLLCVEGLKTDVKLAPARVIADREAARRIAKVRELLKGKNQKQRRRVLRTLWTQVLGNVRAVTPSGPAADFDNANGMRVMRFAPHSDRGIGIPTVVLEPAADAKKPRPLVICVCQSGKAAFLKNRADVVAKFLEAGFAVCVLDLRGTGETRPGTYRGRRSNATGLSSSELMLGGTLVGQRLKDLRSVLALLRNWKRYDAKRIALWGDSFAKTNPPDRNMAVPLGVSEERDHSEPLGHLLVLLTALFEDDVKAFVSNRGGLVSYRSVLQSPFVHIPHDAVVPGAIAAGDLQLLATAVAPRPLWMAGLTDGENKPASKLARSRLKSTIQHGGPPVSKRLHLVVHEESNSVAAAKWLIERLRGQ